MHLRGVHYMTLHNLRTSRGSLALTNVFASLARPMRGRIGGGIKFSPEDVDILFLFIFCFPCNVTRCWPGDFGVTSVTQFLKSNVIYL